MAATTLSESDLKILGLTWQCFKDGPPEIDYHKLAALAEYTNHKSAANKVRDIRKKLAAISGAAGNDGTPPTTPAKNKAAAAPKTPKSRNGKAAAGPKSKTPASKKRKIAGDTNADNDASDEEGAVKVKEEKEGSADVEANEAGGEKANAAKKRGGVKKGGKVKKDVHEEGVVGSIEDGDDGYDPEEAV